MKRSGMMTFAWTLLCGLCIVAPTTRAAEESRDRLRHAVDDAILPMMAKDDIPGMAVGLAIAGQSIVIDYGLASKETRRPVTDRTLFEIGSVTKTFTATLTAWAQVEHHLVLSDKVDKYLPSLQGSRFGDLRLVYLGTHTPGGLPLQVPDGIATDDQLLKYFKEWQPIYPPGSFRTYNNLGIGILGVIAAKSMSQQFSALLERRLLPALGMKDSFINVPESRIGDYAQGYTKSGAPKRMTTGLLWAEAYGMKATARDMTRFVVANMSANRDGKLQRAIMDTHIGYFNAGSMTQDLIWEQYPYPVELNTLLEGNSPRVIFDATRVAMIDPPQAPQRNVWINKTGSTDGFAAYVAFIPAKQAGVVILANRSISIEDRVVMAYQILASIME